MSNVEYCNRPCNLTQTTLWFFLSLKYRSSFLTFSLASYINSAEDIYLSCILITAGHVIWHTPLSSNILMAALFLRNGLKHFHSTNQLVVVCLEENRCNGAKIANKCCLVVDAMLWKRCCVLDVLLRNTLQSSMQSRDAVWPVVLHQDQHCVNFFWNQPRLESFSSKKTVLIEMNPVEADFCNLRLGHSLIS